MFRAAGARYARVARNEVKLPLLPAGPWRSLRFGPSTKPAPSHGVLPGAAGTYGMPWEIVEVNGLLRVIMTGNGIPHNSFRERSRACGAAQRAARARLSSMFFDELAAIVRRSRGTDLTAASVGASSRGRSGGVHSRNPVTHSDHTRSSPGPGVELRWPAAALWRAGEPEVRKITTTDVWEAARPGLRRLSRDTDARVLHLPNLSGRRLDSLPAFIRLRDLAAALPDDSGLRIARAVRRYRSLRIEPPPGTRSRHNTDARF